MLALQHLNESRFFTGCIMILLNIGGKYIANDIPKSAERIMSHWLMRLVVVFAVVFGSTRDVMISVEITIIFIIVFKFLLNEESKLYMIPKNTIEIDTDKNGQVSIEEIEKAQTVLDSYKTKIKQNNY